MGWGGGEIGQGKRFIGVRMLGGSWPSGGLVGESALEVGRGYEKPAWGCGGADHCVPPER